MSRGAIAGLALLLGAFAAAVLWQRSRRAEPASGPDPVLEDRASSATNRLVLMAGGDAPRLPASLVAGPAGGGENRVPAPHEAPGEAPQPDPRRSRPAAGRWVVLRPGETLYHLCIRVYGSSRRLAEVLEANGLDEDAARRLRPGRRIFLP